MSSSTVLKVLYLGDAITRACAAKDVDPGVVVQASGDERQDYTAYGSYFASPRSIALAKAATPSLYDAIILGNNQGNGEIIGQHLPRNVRDRTFVAWNDFDPSMAAPYRALGFSHFGSRTPSKGCLSIKDFFRQVLAAKV